MFRVAPRGKKLRIRLVSTATAQSRNDIRPSADTPVRNGMSTKRGAEGEGVKGHGRLAGARSAALEALALSPAQCVSRGSVRTIAVSVAARPA
jgi:hypothetical protein